MRFAVIGAGFYGLHIASRLQALGFDVDIFEKEDNILCRSSGNNQFRLHLGFHYARNFRTRQQSRDGYYRFLERYEKLTQAVAENLYIVPHGDSLIDFQTYKLIMISSGLDFTERGSPREITHTCGVILTQERVLLVERARQHFYDQLSNRIHLGNSATIKPLDDNVVVNGKIYDYCIDCTWGHLLPEADFFFEPTLLLYYQKKDPTSPPRAYTFVDGPLCSLYPTENPNTYTLSSVPHTPLDRCTIASQALRVISSISSADIKQKRRLMERQLQKYYPSFLDDYEYSGPQLSIKTKPYGSDDDRSCYVKKHGRLIKCLSGKIDNIFYAASEVISLINTEDT